ncbi:hypothetical protein PR048_019475 [Dryococelus australis]|uniref:Uncharacterized protein n=1 Tax=Dryococelus australis TaxID=614101 RepID=A0ABQ9H3K3_9NEOP|nr:hypothetical protein PR048_019475 [Dryococelus australis]
METADRKKRRGSSNLCPALPQTGMSTEEQERRVAGPSRPDRVFTGLATIPSCLLTPSSSRVSAPARPGRTTPHYTRAQVLVTSPGLQMHSPSGAAQPANKKRSTESGGLRIPCVPISRNPPQYYAHSVASACSSEGAISRVTTGTRFCCPHILLTETHVVVIRQAKEKWIYVNALMAYVLVSLGRRLFTKHFIVRSPIASVNICCVSNTCCCEEEGKVVGGKRDRRTSFRARGDIECYTEMEQRWNVSTGQNGSPPRKSAGDQQPPLRSPRPQIWVDPAGNRTRIAIVGRGKHKYIEQQLVDEVAYVCDTRRGYYLKQSACVCVCHVFEIPDGRVVVYRREGTEAMTVLKPLSGWIPLMWRSRRSGEPRVLITLVSPGEVATVMAVVTELSRLDHEGPHCIGVSEEIWAALNGEVLRADEGD